MATPTSTKRFAKGRLRKWTTLIENGIYVEHRHGTLNDPKGLTFTLFNGAKVLAYNNAGGFRTYFRVQTRDGAILDTKWSKVSHALGVALGGKREFKVGHSTIEILVYHKAGPNVIGVKVTLKVPNADAKFWHEQFKTVTFFTRNDECVRLAVGCLAEGTANDVLPLFDKLQEVHSGEDDLERAIGNLFAEVVPVEKLQEVKWRYHDENGVPLTYGQSRQVYMTGLPVEGPDGEWKNY